MAHHIDLGGIMSEEVIVVFLYGVAIGALVTLLVRR